MRSIVSEEISVSDLSADSKKKRKKEREKGKEELATR